MTTSKRLPTDFIKLLEKVVGKHDLYKLIDALDGQPHVSIRLNPRKSIPAPSLNKVPWCSNGYYLTDRPSFTLDPHFHAGSYYVQEPSSMFLEQIIKRHFKETDEIKALDLCAAPGGKSTHLLSLLNNNSLLVSNEVIRSRANVLSENIQKWGNANVLVTQNDPSDFKPIHGYFDLIVVDAPCSGEGLFRKDANALREWSMKNVQHCSLRQRRILSDIFPALSQNGLMVYCTCTYNKIENEQNLKWLSEQENVDFIKIPEAKLLGIEEINVKGIIGYRLLPHRINGEGFFISAFIKRKSEKLFSVRLKQKIKSNPELVKQANEWINDGDKFQFLFFNDSIQFFPKKWQYDIINLSGFLHCIQVGTFAGSAKHEKFIPAHTLAISNELKKEAWSRIELDKDEAIQYLRKEPIHFDGVANGFSLITYQGIGIGWINQLENRYNNLYPTNWRIRMMAGGKSSPEAK